MPLPQACVVLFLLPTIEARMPLPQVCVMLFLLSTIEARRLWEGNPFPDSRGRDASPTEVLNFPSNYSLSAAVPP